MCRCECAIPRQSRSRAVNRTFTQLSSRPFRLSRKAFHPAMQVGVHAPVVDFNRVVAVEIHVRWRCLQKCRGVHIQSHFHSFRCCWSSKDADERPGGKAALSGPRPAARRGGAGQPIDGDAPPGSPATMSGGTGKRKKGDAAGYAPAEQGRLGARWLGEQAATGEGSLNLHRLDAEPTATDGAYLH